MTEAGARAVRDRWESLLPYRWQLNPYGDGYGLVTDAELTIEEWAVLYDDWKRRPSGLPAVPASVWTRPELRKEVR